MKRVLQLLLLCLLLSSCASSGVIVQFKNNSGEDFKQFNARIWDNEFSFENFKAGESRKVRVAKTYRYCGVSVITAYDTLQKIPIDYVGEKLYTSGRVTMIFSIIEGQRGHRRLISKNK